VIIDWRINLQREVVEP